MLRVMGHDIHRSVLVLAVLEALAVYLALFGLATWAVWSPDGPSGLTEAVYTPAALIMIFMIALGVYEPEARADLATMTERLAVACLLGAGLGFVVIYVTSPMWVSPLYAVASAAVAYGGAVAARWTASSIGRATAFRRRILIVGDEGGVADVCALAASAPGAPQVVATLGFGDAMRGGQLLSLAQGKDASEIVVAHRGDEPLPGAALLDCKMRGIRILDYVAYYERETGRVDLDRIYHARFIFADTVGTKHLWRLIKRLTDVGVSLAALVILSPLLLLAALAVRLESPGPAFYRQIRTGLNGAPFEIVKFRSMRQDAEAGGAQWAVANDARVTRVGAFLRRTRIDELPQLWTVLRGDMSLVGPRPERPVFVEQLARDLPFYHDRHRVKPGLTGWAQINYRYGATVEDARVKLQYDLYYMRNFSPLLDLVIMMRTARVVLFPDGVH